MGKKNKQKAIVSLVIILLPILFGLVMWDKLPETMATHWGADGAANGYSSKAFAVFGIPVFLFLIQGLCLYCTFRDKKAAGQGAKVMNMVIWITPVLSLFVNGMVYAAALGKDINIELFGAALLGILFIVIGNYLPKTTQNSTIGIRIPWTMLDKENWNKTHRLGGKVWVIGGVLILFTVFLPNEAMIVSLLVLLTLIATIPIGYSYYIYRKKGNKL